MGILSKYVMRPFARWLTSVEWKHFQEGLAQRGESWDDRIVSSQMDIRDPFHENIVRQTMHPYFFLLTRYKKDAFSKIDSYLRGFEAPDYMREPAERQTFFKSSGKFYAFHKMSTMNFEAEATPVMYIAKGIAQPL